MNRASGIWGIITKYLTFTSSESQNERRKSVELRRYSKKEELTTTNVAKDTTL